MVARVPGCPGTRVCHTTPPLKLQKGEKILHGNPGTRIPVLASPAAAQTLKGEQIVYDNPGTRGCLGPGYPVPVPPQPPPTRSGTPFRISRPGCNSTAVHFCYEASRVGNAMPCHRTGYDRYDIHIHSKRENKTKQNKLNKRQKSTQKNEKGEKNRPRSNQLQQLAARVA